MHIVVCLKQVPDTTEVKVDSKTGTLIREGVPAIVNPYDIHAVEEAVRLKEKHGGKITVISMGPSMALEALKRAVTFGADRTILISDRAFAGSDTLATSYVLTAAIERLHEEEKVDLIFCGKQAIDGDTAQVGPGIAARLDWSQLTYVVKIEDVDLEKKELIAHRKLESSTEVVKAQLPVLITVVKDINELRYSSLPNMIKAARHKSDIWDKSFLRIDESKLGLKGSPTMVRNIFPPPERPGGEMLEGTVDEVVKTLVKKLVPDKIVPNR